MAIIRKTIFLCILLTVMTNGVFANENDVGRQRILDAFQQVAGPLPNRDKLPPLDVQAVHVQEEKEFVRKTIRLTVADGEFASAYLYLPNGAAAPVPAMLVLHGTGMPGKRLVDGESPQPNRALARELARRGYVVIAPDYPSFGDLKDHDFKTDRYESGTMMGIAHHMRCVDVLQTLDFVDPKRIGVIGHSLGGHNAMFVGAFDTRLKVVVSSCGWTLLDYYDIGPAASKQYGGRLGPWAQDRYMPAFRDKYNLDGNRIPFDMDELIMTFAPRAFFSNSPVKDGNFDVTGVRLGIQRARKAYARFGAEEKLQVRYPEAGHDFPPEVRLEAYRFIDRILEFRPVLDECLISEK